MKTKLLKIDARLHWDLKIEAATRGITLKRLADEILNKALREGKNEPDV